MHTSIPSRHRTTVIAAAALVLLACLLAAAAATHDDCTGQRLQGVAYTRPKPPLPKPKAPAAPPAQHVRKVPAPVRPAHTADSHRLGKHKPTSKHHHRRRHHGHGLDADDWPIMMCDDGWNFG